MKHRLKVIPCPNEVEFTGAFFALPKGTSIFDRVSPRKDPAVPPQGYEIRLQPESIEIRASSPQGFFYARQTLLQIEHNYLSALPCGIIRDAPRLEQRIFMVDCARHFISVDDLKAMIDAAALFKFNVFHWHLTDDQGWRIPIECAPRLAQEGAVRSCAGFGSPDRQTPYGRVYTREEIQEIVAYCDARWITVMPEVDMPGHASALLCAYPEWSCTGAPVELKRTNGIFKDVLCPGKEGLYPFLESVLGEVCSLFPGKFIHIGGDETPKGRWKKCPDCRKKMEMEGLDKLAGLQVYFTNRVAAFLKEKGKTVCVWNDSLQGKGLDSELVVTHWMDRKRKKDGAGWANQGGKLICGDFYHAYCDYEYWMTPLKKTYGYDPVLPGTSPEGEKNLCGVETMIWTEWVETLEQLSYLCYPRFAAVAEVGWTVPDQKDEREFEENFRLVTPMLKKIGVHPAPPSRWNARGDLCRQLPRMIRRQLQKK